MKFLIIPISDDLWNSKDMQIFKKQTKTSARRILKGIDVGLERKRFTNACNRIQQLALEYAGDKIVYIEDNKNIEKIFKQFSTNEDIQYPFFEKSKFENLIGKNSFRNQFAKIPELTGVVCLVDGFNNHFDIVDISQRTTYEKQVPEMPDYSNCETDFAKLGEVDKRFHQQIRYSIENGTPIGWINVSEGLVRHEKLISILREYIYVKKQPTVTRKIEATKQIPDENKNKSIIKYAMTSMLLLFILGIWFPVFLWLIILPLIVIVVYKIKPKMKEVIEILSRKTKLSINPIYVRFAYQDGSVGENFPLFGLLKLNGPAKLPVVKVALISDRHFELDSEVDICLIRNSEISRRDEATIAEQEQISFQVARKFFSELLTAKKGVELHLYHTGLEPAVIGTYRAILSTLRYPKFRGKIKVVPKIFMGQRNGFKDLKTWY